MKKLISVLALSLAVFVGASQAQQLPIPSQELVSPNYLVNPGFENGKYGWTASGGATAASNQTAVGAGKFGYEWNSNSAGQTLVSTSVAMNTYPGLQGKNGVAYCDIKAFAATPSHTITVDDGTNNLVTAQTIVASTTAFTRNSVNFIFPSSGTVRIKLTSVSSDEPDIYIDSCFLGEASNINQVSQAQFIGSLTIPETSSCSWSITQTTYASDFSATSACPAATVVGSVTSPSKTPQVQLANAAPGTYRVMFQGHIEPPSSSVNAKCRIIDDLSNVLVENSLAVSGHTTVAFEGTAAYTTVGSRTWKLQCLSASSSMTLHADTTNYGNVSFQVYRFPSSSEVAYRPDLINWRVDASISGANPSLGTSAQTAYTGIEDSGLTLTNNSATGGITAQIPCSSTNAPTGTTCSVGNESVGVSFTLPAAGDVRACASFAHNIVTAATGVVNSTFEIVETPTNAQTISQEGKDRVQSGFNTASSTITFPHKVCGTFSFSSAGQKVLRLFYEQAVTATVTSSLLLADAGANNGQRDIHWEVYPVNQAIPAPVLVNSVISDSSGVEKVARVKYYTTAYGTVCSGDPCGITSSISSATVTKNATGDYTINFPSGTFSAAPTCTVNPSNSGVNTILAATISSGVSATTFNFKTLNSSSGAATNTYGDVVCIGPK